MDCAFDKLDAAGFLEIWQHFDADGEDSWHDIVIFFVSKYIYNCIKSLGKRKPFKFTC